MEKAKTLTESEKALTALETELGEPLLYRSTGQFLAAEGVVPPLNSWGLMALTPTRLVFRHYPQSHPLFGGKDREVRWEVTRDTFQTCEAVIQSWWTKLVSGVSDHVALKGSQGQIALELADDLRRMPRVWSQSLP